jgi:hypothetical protein
MPNMRRGSPGIDGILSVALPYSPLESLSTAMKKPRATKPGRVQKVIKPLHTDIPEKAEISVEGADDLYREIRIENTLEDE